MKLAFVFFSVCLLSCHFDLAAAKEIVVGQNAGGWTLGIKYEPINAVVGDQLVRRISGNGVALSM